MIHIDVSMVSQRLKTIREERKMSGRALAKATDCVLTQSDISRIENAQKIPDMGELLALSWALGVHVDEFFEEQSLMERSRWAARSQSDGMDDDLKRDLLKYLRLRIMLNEVAGDVS